MRSYSNVDATLLVSYRRKLVESLLAENGGKWKHIEKGIMQAEKRWLLRAFQFFYIHS